jgi:hypothetical protein
MPGILPYCMGTRSARHKASGLDQALPWPSDDGDASGADGGEHQAAPAADEDRAEDACAPRPAQAQPTEREARLRPAEPAVGSTDNGVADERQPSPPRRSSPRRRRSSQPGELTPEQRVLRARMAAYRLHATHDPRETTRKAREAFAERFEREVDPDGVLPPAERARRAEAARRAYFTGLALRSSRARRRRA